MAAVTPGAHEQIQRELQRIHPEIPVDQLRQCLEEHNYDTVVVEEMLHPASTQYIHAQTNMTPRQRSTHCNMERNPSPHSQNRATTRPGRSLSSDQSQHSHSYGHRADRHSTGSPRFYPEGLPPMNRHPRSRTADDEWVMVLPEQKPFHSLHVDTNFGGSQPNSPRVSPRFDKGTWVQPKRVTHRSEASLSLSHHDQRPIKGGPSEPFELVDNNLMTTQLLPIHHSTPQRPSPSPSVEEATAQSLGRYSPLEVPWEQYPADTSSPGNQSMTTGPGSSSGQRRTSQESQPSGIRHPPAWGSPEAGARRKTSQEGESFTHGPQPLWGPSHIQMNDRRASLEGLVDPSRQAVGGSESFKPLEGAVTDWSQLSSQVNPKSPPYIVSSISSPVSSPKISMKHMENPLKQAMAAASAAPKVQGWTFPPLTPTSIANSTEKEGGGSGQTNDIGMELKKRSRIQALLAHQKSRYSLMERRVDETRRETEDMRQELGEMENDLAARRTQMPSIATPDAISRLRDEKQRLQIDIELLSRDVSYLLKQSARNPSQDDFGFYPNMPDQPYDNTRIPSQPIRTLPPEPENTTWRCKRCHFDNHQFLPECEMCTHHRDSVSPLAAPHPQS